MCSPEAAIRAAQQGMRMLSAAVLYLVDGQSADLAFEERSDIDLLECLCMTKAKTAALMGCACALGALFGGGRPEQVEHLRGFGEHVGLAFQHVDDLLGIWGDPAVTGKPVYSDLYSRKKSLPVVAALTSDTAAGRELAEIYHRDQPLSGTDVVDVAVLIEKAGGRAWSHAQVDELLSQALRHLRSADPVAKAVDALSALARLATRRDH
jgi:geranylgeranyl diphosphate synthase type I